MKVFKRNAVILTVLLFVCVAVYLNWSYNKREADAETLAGTSQNQEITAADPGDDENSGNPSDQGGNADNSDSAGLFFDGSGGSAAVNTSFFDTTRLNRQQARDEARTTLATVSETAGASQDAIDDALNKISVLASNALIESELESLIMSKGFPECVVYISDDGIKVTVPSDEPGLSTVAVAQITDIVTSETDFSAQDLRIIEVK